MAEILFGILSLILELLGEFLLQLVLESFVVAADWLVDFSIRNNGRVSKTLLLVGMGSTLGIASSFLFQSPVLPSFLPMAIRLVLIPLLIAALISNNSYRPKTRSGRDSLFSHYLPAAIFSLSFSIARFLFLS